MTLYEEERRAYVRRPDWELRNVKKALSMMNLLNTERENARLQAVSDILAERRKT